MSLGPFPTFLIIGAQKSATRWLRVNLGQHPDVFTVAREVEFFNSNFKRGAAWYRAWFDGWRGERAIGEATPGYMMWSERPRIVAARIDGMLPGVRLLAILRNPVDRAYSAFIHHMDRGRIPPESDLLEFVTARDPETDRLGIISGGWYARSLEPYLRRFGARLLVLLHDDVASDPVGLYGRAAAHVGVSPEPVPEALQQVRYSNAVPEASGYATAQGGRRQLTVEERGTLFEFFREDVARLEGMFDLDVARWRVDERPAVAAGAPVGGPAM